MTNNYDFLTPTYTEEEFIEIIKKDKLLYDEYMSFEDIRKTELLDFVTCKNSLLITYDNFFKKIFSPDEHKSRLKDLISSLLEIDIEDITVLTSEGSMISDKGSFVSMDIVVKTSDGSFIDVEIQKCGYLFPGERSECYMSDLIMRQYNMKKDEYGKDFSYDKLRPTYLLILVENSPEPLKKMFPAYYHKGSISYDTGLELSSIENIIYISLDTFNKQMHNKDVTNKKVAWLTFLSCTDINKIKQLVKEYPEFIEIYREINEFRKSPGELITMFSEALRIMDHNLERMMVEQLRIENEQQRAIIADMQTDLDGKDAALADKDAALADKDAALADRDAALADKDAALADRDAALADKDAALADKDAEIQRLKDIINANNK